MSDSALQISSKTIESASMNQKALRNVTAKVIDVRKDMAKPGDAPGKSQALKNPLEKLMSSGEIIEPPFDLLTLSMIPEHNTEMTQCIEAMETNIEGFGHRYVPRVKAKQGKDLPEQLKNTVQKEKVALENFFMYCTRESFIKFRRKLRKDLETTGNAYFEIVRSQKGDIQSFNHIPSYQIGIGRVEQDHRLVKRPILQLQEDMSVKIVQIDEYRRFRKYVQTKSVRRRNMDVLHGHKVRWFKEFGDERIYNADTGKEADASLDQSKRATELMHLSIYSSRSPYGLPRYIGVLLSIFGDRAAEEVNFITLRNNNIPSMVVAVSNGQLTEGTITRIQEFVDSQIQGSDNYSKFLIIEAETDEEGEDGGQVKLDIRPLTQEQHTDALFQNYSAKNQDKVRRIWRLPPIFVGRSDDYTRATAESSRRLADEQIFAPERDEFDALMNRILFPVMGVMYHKFKSNSPNTTDNTQLVKILAGAEKTGGMTPRISRIILEDILGIELPEPVVDFDIDAPFSLTMAEAVKNQAMPNEPGQQTTALKRLLGDDEEEFEVECSECGNIEHVTKEDTSDPLVDHIIALNERVEKKWKGAILKDSNFESHED